MSLAQFLRILMVRRAIILAMIVVGIAVAVAVITTLPARFPAKARVLMDVIKPDPVSGQVISSSFVRGYTRTQTELITDYRVAGDVVDKLKWADNPALVAEYNANADGTEDFRRYRARRIIERTSAGLLSGSNILEITYWSTNPMLAKSVVSALRDAYIDGSLRFRTDAAGRSADWYVDQAAKAQAALSAAEAQKSAYEREKNIVVGPGGVDSETSKLESMQGALMASRGSAGYTEIAIERSTPTSGMVEQLRGQLNSIDDAIAQANERLGRAHPTYVALAQRRATVQAQIARETAVARNTGGNVGALTRANAARLEAEYEAQKTRVLGLKGDLNRLSALQREVDLRRSQYERAAARAADLKLESNVSETGLVPLGEAFVSGTPSFPNKPLIIALGVFGGLGLGILAAIATEMLARRVRGPEDLASASKVPVLAVIASAAPVSLGTQVRRLLRLPGTRDDWQPAE